MCCDQDLVVSDKYTKIISILKGILFMPHFFSGIKPSDKSGAALRQFQKDSKIYRAIKNLDFARCKVTAVTTSGVWKNLCLQFVLDFRGFEKVDEESKEVFSNLVTLSKKLELDLQVDSFTELLAVHKRSLLTKTWWNWRGRERMKRDKRKKQLKMQEMARRFSLFEEALLVFEA